MKWSRIINEKTILASIVIFAACIRLKYFGIHRFHIDEALYASWAARIYEKLDFFFNGLPGVDKPPLLFYLQAISFWLFGFTENTARIPNFIAGLVDVYLIYLIGKSYFNKETGFLSAAILAITPAHIAFSPTGYTDPLMITWFLLSLYLISREKMFLAGCIGALSFATNQFGILFLPLLVLVAIVNKWNTIADRKSLWNYVKTFLGGYVSVFLIVVFIGLFYHSFLGFFIAQVQSQNQLLESAPGSLYSRMQTWFFVFGFVYGIKTITISLVFLLSCQFIYDSFHARKRENQLSLIFFLFAVSYILLLSILYFRFYDRYILVIVPTVALLLGRALSIVMSASSQLIHKCFTGRGWMNLIYAVPFLLFVPVMAYDRHLDRNTSMGALFAYFDGVEQVAYYLKERVPSGASICFDEVDWEYHFYCHGCNLKQFAWKPTLPEITDLLLSYPDKQWYVVLRNKKDRNMKEQMLGPEIQMEKVFETAKYNTKMEGFTIYRIIVLNATN